MSTNSLFLPHKVMYHIAVAKRKRELVDIALKVVIRYGMVAYLFSLAGHTVQYTTPGHSVNASIVLQTLLLNSKMEEIMSKKMERTPLFIVGAEEIGGRSAILLRSSLYFLIYSGECFCS